MNAVDLPMVGSLWIFHDDVDQWAWCRPEMEVKLYQAKEGEGGHYWKVDQTFSTKPLKKCHEANVNDPMMEAPKVSGTFVKESKEAVTDRYGKFLLSSSLEMLRGPQVEFDNCLPTVKIEQNVLNLGLSTFCQMVATVNGVPMWGLAKRCVKLANISWERKIYGACCYYYTRSFDFEINYNTFDRWIMDEGTRVLRGHKSKSGKYWVLEKDKQGNLPDVTNPQDFIAAKDITGENNKIPLDGYGKPNFDINNPIKAKVEFYAESNFFTLGIPTSF